MNLFTITYLAISIFSTIGILIESFSYSGIIRSHFLFDVRALVMLSLLFAVLNLVRKTPDELPKLISETNKFLILPSTAILTISFSVIELIKYPNFIFSTFHLNYDCFFYLFIISASIFIFSLDKKQIMKNKDRSIFILSIFLIIIFSLIRTWPGGIFFILIKEDNIFENLQFIFYFFAAILALLISLSSLSKKNKLTFIYFLGFSTFLFFIAGEEISWGQRILGITSPEIATEINTQNETTIHNIKGLNDLQPIMYLAFSLYLSSAWIFLKAFPKKLRYKFEDLVPAWNYAFYFLPIFTFYTHINILGGKHWEWQEACELMMAIGLFIFMFEKVRENKILR